MTTRQEQCMFIDSLQTACEIGKMTIAVYPQTPSVGGVTTTAHLSSF